MPNQLKQSDVARLVDELHRRGKALECTSIDDFQQQQHVNFRTLVQLSTSHAETIALLLERARHARTSRVRELGLGALDYACAEATEHPARAQFALRFGVEKIREATTGDASVGPVGLSREIEQLAGELFELAKTDRSFSDEVLNSAVKRLSTPGDLEPRLLTRLRHELQFLQIVLNDPNSPAQYKASARGALTYFAEVADAIPDELGLVGLLDDAFVVQRAVREIRPERAALGEILDGISSNWPFLQDLCFDSNSANRFSEFVVVNCGILLADLTGEKSDSVALMLGAPGPLPFLLGFVWALNRVRRTLADSPIDFETGTILENLQTGARVRLVDFGTTTIVGQARAFVPCGRDLATHVKLEQASGLTIPTIPALRSYRRATSAKLRGTVSHKDSRLPLGPLEKLFCSVNPIRLPPATKRVLVVAPLGDCRRAAEHLTLFGTSLFDVIPTGQGTLNDDGPGCTIWTKHGPGGEPWIVVVRTLGEALDLIDSDPTFVQVICQVRPGTTDVVSLRRIFGKSIPVVALLVQSDVESALSLAADGFRFWTWSPQWLNALVWEQRTPSDCSELDVYEQAVKRSVNAQLHEVILEAPEIEKAFESIERLDSEHSGTNEESVTCFMTEAYALFVRLCRQVIPSGATRRDFNVVPLQTIADTNANYWDDALIRHATSTIDCLRSAADALLVKNPKREALVDWVKSNPEGIIIGTEALQPLLAQCCKNTRTLLASDLDWRNLNSAVLVPSWLGRRRMDRLLNPLHTERLTLLLYRPEATWCHSAQKRYLREQGMVLDAMHKNPVFRTVRRATPADFPPPATPLEIDIEDRVRAYQDSRLARVLTHAEGQDLINARLVRFSGGPFALFQPRHKVQIVSPMPTPSLKPVAVENLEPGMLALLLRDSDKDVIWDEVNRTAPDHLRANTLFWRQAVRRYIAVNSYERLRLALDRAGCKRKEHTLRRWASDEDMIQPHRGETDIRAILEATRDVELEKHLDDCIAAVSQIWGMHLSTGRRLAAQSLQRVQDKLNDAVGPQHPIELDDRVVLCAVESIDLEPIRVTRSVTNRISGLPPLDSS